MACGHCSGAGRKGFLNDLGLNLRLLFVSVVLITILSPPGTMANGTFIFMQLFKYFYSKFIK